MDPASGMRRGFKDGAVTSLAERWRAAARGAGATASDDALDAAARDLLTRWSEPHRRYHDRTHLTTVLDVVDRHAHLVPHPDSVRLAAWLHDAVYDPRAPAGANERDSAVLASDLLTRLGMAPEVATDVTTLVALTDGHAAADGDPDGALLCDADLAILAEDPERYAAYASAIREEYAHVPDDAFRTGRARILRSLLALPSIYRLPPLRRAWEARARLNLTTELADLS
jgi:predicted metal-dependent HD superfamily phosphohydrolase